MDIFLELFEDSFLFKYHKNTASECVTFCSIQQLLLSPCHVPGTMVGDITQGPLLIFC